MGSWSLQRALEFWIEYREKTKQRGKMNNRRPWERTAAKHLAAVLGGGRRLDSIALLDLRVYEKKRAEAGCRPKTINNEIGLLRTVLKEANLWRKFRDVYRPLPVPKAGPGRAITMPEAKRLIEVGGSNDCWFVALWATILALTTGLRSYEIKALRIGDVVLRNADPILRVRREITKTNAGAREVALNALALHALRKLLSRAELLGVFRAEHYLLPGNMSKHTRKTDLCHDKHGFDPATHQSTWGSAWTSLRQAAGLSDFRFHDTRHSYITMGVAAGIPVPVLMEQVGHCSPEMVRYYTHLADGVREVSSAKFEGYVPELVSVLGVPGKNSASSSPS